VFVRVFVRLRELACMLPVIVPATMTLVSVGGCDWLESLVMLMCANLPLLAGFGNTCSGNCRTLCGFSTTPSKCRQICYRRST